MFKLMIADDNPHTLKGLSESTDWENFDFTLSGTFQDGQELLNAAKEDMPDLVITDISMPVMDGMDLSAQLYRLKPDIKIIFISSYSEFDYARTALKLGIFDYLLKPIRLGQLLDVMGRVLEKLRCEQIERFEQQKVISQHDYFRKSALSHYVSRLFFHAQDELHIREELAQLGLTFTTDHHLYVICFSLDSSLDARNQLQSYNYLQSILEYDFEEAQIIPTMLENCHGVFVLLTHKESLSVYDLLSKLSVDIETKMDLCITMGYSNCSSKLTDLPLLYEQAKTTLHNLPKAANNAPLASYTDVHMDSNAPASPKANTNISANVAAMRSFIEEHYTEQITTNDVTGSVYLSPSYANRCFLAECGTTIFGYIIQCRLEKAKQLLRETDVHITRIAEDVGYSAKTSFYLAFKRHTGISPTEYRQQYTESE